jgi:predicted nucleotidyltransferase
MNLANVQAHLQRCLQGLMAIYLFGSQAKGCATDTSDVDLAVLVPGYVDPLLRWELAGELSGLVHCPVDLVDLRSASTVMQYQIITTGRCLWSTGLEVGLYEAFILSQKTDLDTARAGLLNDIYQSGVVHGR